MLLFSNSLYSLTTIFILIYLNTSEACKQYCHVCTVKRSQVGLLAIKSTQQLDKLGQCLGETPLEYDSCSICSTKLKINYELTLKKKKYTKDINVYYEFVRSCSQKIEELTKGRIFEDEVVTAWVERICDSSLCNVQDLVEDFIKPHRLFYVNSCINKNCSVNIGSDTKIENVDLPCIKEFKKRISAVMCYSNCYTLIMFKENTIRAVTGCMDSFISEIGIDRKFMPNLVKRIKDVGEYGLKTCHNRLIEEESNMIICNNMLSKPTSEFIKTLLSRNKNNVDTIKEYERVCYTCYSRHKDPTSSFATKCENGFDRIHIFNYEKCNTQCIMVVERLGDIVSTIRGCSTGHNHGWRIPKKSSSSKVRCGNIVSKNEKPMDDLTLENLHSYILINNTSKLNEFIGNSTYNFETCKMICLLMGPNRCIAFYYSTKDSNCEIIDAYRYTKIENVKKIYTDLYIRNTSHATIRKSCATTCESTETPCNDATLTTFLFTSIRYVHTYSRIALELKANNITDTDIEKDFRKAIWDALDNNNMEIFNEMIEEHIKDRSLANKMLEEQDKLNMTDILDKEDILSSDSSLSMQVCILTEELDDEFIHDEKDEKKTNKFLVVVIVAGILVGLLCGIWNLAMFIEQDDDLVKIASNIQQDYSNSYSQSLT